MRRSSLEWLCFFIGVAGRGSFLLRAYTAAAVSPPMRMQNSYDIAQTRRRAGKIKVARFLGKVGDPSPALA